MIEIALHRSLSRNIACSDVRQWGQGDISRGWRDKSADVRRADMAGGVGDVGPRMKSSAGAFSETRSEINISSAVAYFERSEIPMKPRDDELRIRPGRIRDRGRGAARPRSFRRSGHAGRQESRAHRQGFWPGRTKSRLPLRPRPFRGVGPVAPLAVTSSGDQGARRPASGQSIPLGTAHQTRQLSEAGWRHPRWRRRPYVRCAIGRRR